MNTAKKLTLGMLRGSGGGPPESITDDLSSDSGLWLDGELTSAAITIDTGRAVWSPTEEAERNTTANATSDPNGNEANGTTSWQGLQVTLSVEPTDVDTGNYALKAVSTDGWQDRANFEKVNSSRKWRINRAAAKSVTGTTWVLSSNGATPAADVPITSSWADYIWVTRKTGDYSWDNLWLANGVAGHTALIDNFSSKELTLASQFRIQRIYYPSSVQINAWMSGFTPLGVTVFQDVDNWIVALAHRTGATFNITLLKCVAGTTEVVGSDVSTVYSAGALLELIPAADFQTWTVKYNTAVRINAAAITDFAPSGTWYAGLFNTHNPSDVDAAGFDDFAATRLAGASPFEYAPAEVGASATVTGTAVIVTGADEPNWYGRPTVAVLADETIVMVYKRNAGHTNDGNGTLHIRFSDDYGENWTVEDTSLGGDAVSGFPITSDSWTGNEEVTEPWLYLAPNGTLLLHLWRYDWGLVSGDGSYQATSADGGLTWNTPASIGLTGTDYADVTFTTNDDTTVSGVIYAGCSFSVAGVSNHGLIKSVDNGATWEYVADIVLGGYSEIGIEYVGNSTFVAVLRSTNNVSTGTTLSADMGVTWSAVTNIGYLIGGSGRHRIWTAAHLRGESNWESDPRLIMCGFVTADGVRRSCVWLSKNAGLTWSLPQYVDDTYADAGYGDMFYNPGTGQYVFLCYRGTTSKADIIQYSISIDWGT